MSDFRPCLVCYFLHNVSASCFSGRRHPQSGDPSSNPKNRKSFEGSDACMAECHTPSGLLRTNQHLTTAGEASGRNNVYNPTHKTRTKVRQTIPSVSQSIQLLISPSVNSVVSLGIILTYSSKSKTTRSFAEGSLYDLLRMH